MAYYSFCSLWKGGAGFSVLDVTNPQTSTLVSIYNDKINNRVYRVDHNQVIYNYDYISNLIHSLLSFQKSCGNYNDDFNGSGVDDSKQKM